jgi:hypothetical protein
VPLGECLAENRSDGRRYYFRRPGLMQKVFLAHRRQNVLCEPIDPRFFDGLSVDCRRFRVRREISLPTRRAIAITR